MMRQFMTSLSWILLLTTQTFSIFAPALVCQFESILKQASPLFAAGSARLCFLKSIHSAVTFENR
jgi:hypothetical protein